MKNRREIELLYERLLKAMQETSDLNEHQAFYGAYRVLQWILGFNALLTHFDDCLTKLLKGTDQ